MKMVENLRIALRFPDLLPLMKGPGWRPRIGCPTTPQAVQAPPFGVEAVPWTSSPVGLEGLAPSLRAYETRALLHELQTDDFSGPCRLCSDSSAVRTRRSPDRYSEPIPRSGHPWDRGSSCSSPA